MKPRNDFEVGQIVEAKVMSIVDEYHLVVAIEGFYFRVDNQTPMNLKINENVKLVVDSASPLRFKIHKQVLHGHTDFHI